MNSLPWTSIRSFDGDDHFQMFRRWIEGEVAQGRARQVPVAGTYRGSMLLQQNWFENAATPGVVWRLVWPDPPFAGLFVPVEESE